MREIKAGKRYRHFKGREVLVEAIAKDSETLENIVVYKHLLNNEFWVRPYDMFNSEVDKEKYPNIKQKYRFEEIDN